MLKKIKLKNSFLILIGIIIIFTGILIGSYEYLLSKKESVFSQMNIILYESEEPKNIDSEKTENEIPGEDEIDNENESDTPLKENNSNSSTIKYDYIGVLEIPKINLKRGFLNLNSRYNNVDYNVTVINGSTFPDKENNNLILAAHSGYCSYCYFDNLYKLSIGDYAYITYNNNKYIYKIVNIYEVEKDGTVAIHRDYTKSVLTLITCTRNSDTKQTVYILELED